LLKPASIYYQMSPPQPPPQPIVNKQPQHQITLKVQPPPPQFQRKIS
jgi:hypothetical protein